MNLQRLAMSDTTLESFVSAVEAADGFPPLSEHKLMRLGGGDDAVVVAWSSGGQIAAVSVAALHEGDAPHWALEVATDPDRRTPELERDAIAAAASTIPDSGGGSLWVHRAEQLSVAQSLGYQERRRVLRMEGPLPTSPGVTDLRLGTLEGADDAAVIDVHNRAFAGHREASGMTQHRLDALRALPWYDADGVVTAWIDKRLAGFCWTKLHPDGAGEVYLLAVDPEAHGRGVGEALATAGYRHLEKRGAQRAMLWVDGDNEPAIALYERLGLQTTHANVELALSSG